MRVNGCARSLSLGYLLVVLYKQRASIYWLSLICLFVVPIARHLHLLDVHKQAGDQLEGSIWSATSATTRINVMSTKTTTMLSDRHRYLHPCCHWNPWTVRLYTGRRHRTGSDRSSRPHLTERTNSPYNCFHELVRVIGHTGCLLVVLNKQPFIGCHWSLFPLYQLQDTCTFLTCTSGRVRSLKDQYDQQQV